MQKETKNRQNQFKTEMILANLTMDEFFCSFLERRMIIRPEYKRPRCLFETKISENNPSFCIDHCLYKKQYKGEGNIYKRFFVNPEDYSRKAERIMMMIGSILDSLTSIEKEQVLEIRVRQKSISERKEEIVNEVDPTRGKCFICGETQPMMHMRPFIKDSLNPDEISLVCESCSGFWKGK